MMSHYPKAESKPEKGEVDIYGPEKITQMKEEPLKDLILSSHAVLEEAHHTGRLKCSTCGGSRIFYCYSCCLLVGLNPQLVPKIKLPIKIDIIKHPNETDGKSTAVHAKLIAPDDVSIYIYPCIPELDGTNQNVVLVFPGPGAVTVQDLVGRFSKNVRKRGAQSPTEQRHTKKLKPEQNASTHTHFCDPESAEHPLKPEGMVQRVVFIDSTWNQTTKIITDERLQGLVQVELRSKKTCFWRHQRGSPDSYLATIEAVYYFLKDFHVHCLHREYRGEYDDLLFFYSFLHKLINRAKQAAGKS